jgi:hypothetical protein
MAAPWVGILQQSIPEWTGNVLDTTIYKRLWLAMLQNRGRVRTGVNGSYEKDRSVDWKEAPVTSFGYGQGIDYAPQNYLKKTSLDWKSLIASDTMHIIEYMEMGGDAGSPTTIVNRYRRIIPKLMSGIKNKIGLQIYADANATGKELDFDGLETACSTVEAAGSITSSTCAATDIVAAHSTTALYQGLPTYTAQAGSWSGHLGAVAHTAGYYPNHVIHTDWPEGHGDPEYAYRSPILANWSSTKWGTDKATWEGNAQRCLSRVGMWIRNTAGGQGNGSSLMCMLSTDMMAGFKNSLRASNLILTPHKESETLGFGDVLNYEGLGTYCEYGCPPQTGYVLDMDDIELMFVSKDLVETRGPFEESDGSYKWYAISLGNFSFDPRRIAKVFNYA